MNFNAIWDMVLIQGSLGGKYLVLQWFIYELTAAEERGEKVKHAILEVFRIHFFHKFIASGDFSHAFDLAESNGTIHFALRGRERLPQSG